MTNKFALFMVRIDAPAGRETDWNTWLNTRHIPDRLALPGFLFAHRFAAVDGEPKYLNLYVMTSADVMNSEHYTKLREKEAARPPDSFEAITSKLPVQRGVYEPIYPEGADYQLSRAKFLLTAGLDVPAEVEAEFNDWYNTEHIPDLMRVPGFRTVQRLVATKTPISAKSGRPPSGPKYIAFYDIESEKVLESQAFSKARESPWSDRIRKLYTRRFHNAYRLIYLPGSSPNK